MPALMPGRLGGRHRTLNTFPLAVNAHVTGVDPRGAGRDRTDDLTDYESAALTS